ncbi:TIGR04282 family arsenosugar biosynthesis glycosyltransferase [uncultured Pseudodesulfovibrio sp.]|uniref:TIGR04282 family arsenosugar biosynthesis glycosyltransferase n=1 Tax=uncultured Pseudodesulfovibrio sp. TaxID=2035858 RepID=UPI0029C88661|nr:TIGR04282 family arsenosugar biosynthesis glycosyltransferase [uncultured Pseudodesulfovibrio sp.]
MRDCLLFFVRYPEPGNVKTRLVGPASPETVAEFYRALVEDLLDRFGQELGADLILCFTPAERQREMLEWLGPTRRLLPQRGKELGERMTNGFADAFTMGYDRAVLIGSDIPCLTSAIIRQGLDALKPERVCLGPAEDGGYYLVGFHRDGFLPELFDEPEWGGRGVFTRALERLAEAGTKVSVLERLTDLDTVADLGNMLDSPDCPLQGRVLELARRVAGR